MLAPEDIQRRIEKSLAEGGFTPAEMLLRHAHRLSLENASGSKAAADTLLREAGFSVDAEMLTDVVDRKPWLVQAIVLSAGRKGNGADHAE